MFSKRYWIQSGSSLKAKLIDLWDGVGFTQLFIYPFIHSFIHSYKEVGRTYLQTPLAYLFVKADRHILEQQFDTKHFNYLFVCIHPTKPVRILQLNSTLLYTKINIIYYVLCVYCTFLLSQGSGR